MAKRATSPVKAKARNAAKEQLASRGLAPMAWAKQNNVSPDVVYRVLDGRCKALRGEGHKVAVLLGIKQGEIA